MKLTTFSQEELDFNPIPIVIKRLIFTIYGRKITEYFLELEEDDLISKIKSSFETAIIHRQEVFYRVPESEQKPNTIYLKRAFYTVQEKALSSDNAYFDDYIIEKFHYIFASNDEDVVKSIKIFAPKTTVTTIENYILHSAIDFTPVSNLELKYFNSKFIKCSKNQ